MGGSGSRGQKMKKLFEDKCYTFYFLTLSLFPSLRPETTENRSGGGAWLPPLGGGILAKQIEDFFKIINYTLVGAIHS